MPDAYAQIDSLLGQLFDDAGLRRFVRGGPEGQAIAAALPEATLSTTELAHLAVQQLARRGVLEARTFERLQLQFPARRREIQAVLQTWASCRPPLRFPAGLDTEELGLPDAARRLNDAYQRRETLVIAGEDTRALDAEIGRLRGELRRGPALQRGECLDEGRYGLIDVIGHGGVGTVWRAFDRVLQKWVAIKVLHGHLSADAGLREQFFRSARTTASLGHRRVVRVMRERCEDEGFAFHVTEHLPGGDLLAAIREGRFNFDACLRHVMGVCEALHEAHEQGLVHGGVKPSNILFDGRGSARLTDFDLGLADPSAGGARVGFGLGSLLFAAPETMRPDAAIDRRADVYGVAMTLAFCLHGRLPDGEVLHGGIEHFVAHLACSADLKQILLRALSRRPEARHASALELQEALQEALSYRGPPGARKVITPAPARAGRTILLCHPRTRPAPVPPADDVVERVLRGELGGSLVAVQAAFIAHYAGEGISESDAAGLVREKLREWIAACQPSRETVALLIDNLAHALSERRRDRDAFLVEIQQILDGGARAAASGAHRRGGLFAVGGGRAPRPYETIIGNLMASPAPTAPAQQLRPDLAREAYYQDVYEEFVRFKLENNEPIDDFEYEPFAARMRENTAELMKSGGVKDVQFFAYIHEGKVALKVRVIRA